MASSTSVAAFNYSAVSSIYLGDMASPVLELPTGEFSYSNDLTMCFLRPSIWCRSYMTFYISNLDQLIVLKKFFKRLCLRSLSPSPF